MIRYAKVKCAARTFPEHVYVKKIYAAIGTIFLMISPATSKAHGLSQMTSTTINHDESASDRDKLLDSANIDAITRNATSSIIHVASIWRKKSNVITVCFGPALQIAMRTGLIKQVVNTASEWTTGTTIQFDFGKLSFRVCQNASSADIRIDIRQPVDAKHAIFDSLIGNEAASYSIDGDFPYSMRLLFPSGDPHFDNEDVKRFYILHEFGHALGADHEHQRLDCSFNYQFIADHFGFKDASIAEIKMKDIFGSYNESAYPEFGAVEENGEILTRYDRYTVMQYNLSIAQVPGGDDPRVYTDLEHDKCFRTVWVSDLTDYDRAGMQRAYGNASVSSALIAKLVTSPNARLLSAPVRAELSKLASGPSATVKNPEIGGSNTPEFGKLKSAIDLVSGSSSAMRALNQILGLKHLGKS